MNIGVSVVGKRVYRPTIEQSIHIGVKSSRSKINSHYPIGLTSPSIPWAAGAAILDVGLCRTGSLAWLLYSETRLL